VSSLFYFAVSWGATVYYSQYNEVGRKFHLMCTAVNIGLLLTTFEVGVENILLMADTLLIA